MPQARTQRKGGLIRKAPPAEKQRPYTDLSILAYHVPNSRANIDMALRGLSGAQADLRGAVSAVSAAEIPAGSLTGALNALAQAEVALQQILYLIGQGEAQILDSRGYRDYFQAVYGCDPTGALQ